jgi:Ca2+-binding RTX toxin-like protein
MSISDKVLNTLIGTELPDSIQGTGGDDSILGLGGNDNLYGEGGNDLIDAGDGADFVMPALAPVEGGHYGLDIISTGAGDDLVNYHFSADRVIIDGGSGNDYLIGSSAGDTLSGGEGNDRLSGYKGADTMTGGAGADVFAYSMAGEAGLSALTADRITDFDGSVDTIDMRVEGYFYNEDQGGGGGPWSRNYVETTIAYGAGYEAAHAVAADIIGGGHYKQLYAFVTDGVNGYLFADFDGDRTADTSIILDGLTDITQFSASDIV